MSENPYESPRTLQRDSELWKGLPRSELLFIVLAALCFFGIGSAGAALVANFSVGGDGGWMGDTGIATMIWIHWGGKVIGRFCGDFLAGLVLGRHVRRIKQCTSWRA